MDGKKALLAMIALDEIRGRLAEAGLHPFGHVCVCAFSGSWLSRKPNGKPQFAWSPPGGLRATEQLTVPQPVT